MASDWAFMVSRDSAADYARDRHLAHVRRIRAGLDGHPVREASDLAVVPHLDARALQRPGMTSRLRGQREVSPAVEVHSEV